MSREIRAEKLIEQIGTEAELDALVQETGADVQVKKLGARTMLKLLVYGVLTSERASLRVLEQAYNSQRFKTHAGLGTEMHTRHSSLGDRLRGLPVALFQHVFDREVRRYGAQLKQPYRTVTGAVLRLNRFDSTMVRCSAKLLRLGMVTGRKRRQAGAPEHAFRHLKFTVGFDGTLPRQVAVHTQQSALSDNDPLTQAVSALSVDPRETVVAVFDQGVTDHRKLIGLSDSAHYFVTRAKPTTHFHVVKAQRVRRTDRTATCQIVSDQLGYINVNDKPYTATLLRLVVAQSLKPDRAGELIYFLTNLTESTQVSAVDITEIYRWRWDIEVFFRFMKQEMNLSHLISRDANGLQVMLYTMLIAAILVLVFRQRNRITSYKLAKLQFVDQLYDSIIKLAIALCGGNPHLYDALPARGVP
jgi:hypothetical protein